MFITSYNCIPNKVQTDAISSLYVIVYFGNMNPGEFVFKSYCADVLLLNCPREQTTMECNEYCLMGKVHYQNFLMANIKLLSHERQVALSKSPLPIEIFVINQPGYIW